MIQSIVLAAFLAGFLFADTVHAADWKLIWSEEFDQEKLDTDTWSIEDRSWYKSPATSAVYKKENVILRDGKLHLPIVAQSGTVSAVDRDARHSGRYSFSLGRITTKDKFSFQYGKVEVRVKFPAVPGSKTAVWMLGNSKGSVPGFAAGEIDILETNFTVEKGPIFGTIHYQDETLPDAPAADRKRRLKHAADGGTSACPEPDSEGFHVAGIIWDERLIRWFIDGKEYHRASIAETVRSEFHEPFYLMIQHNTGGPWEKVIDKDLLPVEFIVDYVRIYQR